MVAVVLVQQRPSGERRPGRSNRAIVSCAKSEASTWSTKDASIGTRSQLFPFRASQLRSEFLDRVDFVRRL
jgi:hypothetical protein